MATQITADDIQYVENVVSKKYELNQNSDGLYTVAFDANSSNEVSKSYYNKLNSYFYVSDKTITGSNDASRGQIASYSKTHLYPHTEHSGSARQHKDKWYGKGVLFNIPKKYYGEAIKAKSFQIHDTTNNTNIIIKDDGVGNLYSTTATVSQSNNSVSSSDNYVGNIFYEYGIVNITETGSYANNYWDLDNTGFETSSPSMTSENNIPHGIFFKPDGTRYYMIGSQGSKEGVYEYSMTTAWDVSTATYTGNYFDISHYSADAWRSISFKPDGTRLFLTNEDSDTIKAYDLDIAWDLSSFDTDDFGSIETFNLDGATTIVENKPKGHYFREDGLKLYIVGETNNSAIEYNLSSAFDLTSIIGNTSQSYDIGASVSPAETEINGIHFKPDGTRMYTGGNDNNVVYEHILSTPWDVSTATFNTSESINSEDTQIHDVKWKPDGSKMYIVGHGSDKVHQYQHSASFYSDLGTTYEMTFNSRKSVHTIVYDCNLPSNQYNWTNNLTILKNPPQELNLRIAVHSQREANVTELQDVQSHYIHDTEIDPKYRTADFNTFVTRLYFYNKANELLMTATLPQPIRKSKIKDMKIKVQMDY